MCLISTHSPWIDVLVLVPWTKKHHMEEKPFSIQFNLIAPFSIQFNLLHHSAFNSTNCTIQHSIQLLHHSPFNSTSTCTIQHSIQLLHHSAFNSTYCTIHSIHLQFNSSTCTIQHSIQLILHHSAFNST